MKMVFLRQVLGGALAKNWFDAKTKPP